MQKKIAIVGNPNVGKSVIFNSLTGTYVTVSNYPGTTVEITSGKLKIGSMEFEVIDTPGMYSMLPITEEERIARRIIIEDKPDLILHIVDAKNLDRMLPLTFQLIETKIPLILILNIIDEAEKVGIAIDTKLLKDELGISVLSTVATIGYGIDTLKKEIKSIIETLPEEKVQRKLYYDEVIESSLSNIESLLKGEYNVQKRVISLLLLQDDNEMHTKVKEKERNYNSIVSIIRNTKDKYTHSLSFVLALNTHTISAELAGRVLTYKKESKKDYLEKFSRILMSPITGFLILAIVLYYGLYKFVGEFAAGFLVDFLEETVFGRYILPPVSKFVDSIIPLPVIRELFTGEYGIFSLGIRYAIAIIFPIVTTFFLVFAIIEDTGYLPRLAMLIDRMFKYIGLSGRAVIPMVLGLGCDTMATMVTRTLPTNRERIIATILLALAVPCSAQIGVIFGLLSGNSNALIIWFVVILFIFSITGYLASKVIPGYKPVFFIEIPPLRLPKFSNVVIKTYTRLKWYFMEIFPLFIYASILIWVGNVFGIFDIIIKILEYPVRWIGLPDKTAIAFLFGFFRRDYGAAGLFDMNKTGLFNSNQILVATITLTLFLPCIAQFLINIKERGIKMGIGISVFILFFSFTIGYLVNFFLNTFNIRI